MKKIYLGFWKTNDFWRYTNPFWYLINAVGTVFCVAKWTFNPLFRLIRLAKKYVWYKRELPKKNIEFHRSLVRNFEVMMKAAKDINSFKKKMWLEFKAYEYCKNQIDIRNDNY